MEVLGCKVGTAPSPVYTAVGAAATICQKQELAIGNAAQLTVLGIGVIGVHVKVVALEVEAGLSLCCVIRRAGGQHVRTQEASHKHAKLGGEIYSVM